MFCNFCGKNFDSSEGFEEVSRGGHHYVRCEKCVYNQRDEEYDWHTEMYGRGFQNQSGRQASSMTKKGTRRGHVG